MRFEDLVSVCHELRDGNTKLQAVAAHACNPEWTRIAKAVADSLFGQTWIGERPDSLLPVGLAEAFFETLQVDLYLRHGRYVLSTLGEQPDDEARLSAAEACRLYGGSLVARAIVKGGTHVPGGSDPAQDAEIYRNSGTGATLH